MPRTAGAPHYLRVALQPLGARPCGAVRMVYNVAQEAATLARGFRVWLERDEATGQPVARAARIFAGRPSVLATEPWLSPVGADTRWPFAGPWALLLAFLNLERRVPPYDWPRHQWVECCAPDWDDWKRFQQETGAPYLLAEDQGHPLLWFPASDGEMYGFLFDFGLQSGRWSWWVPGTERVVHDPHSGTTMMIMMEGHPEGADAKAIRELLDQAPPGLFDVDPAQFQTLQEALDSELRYHPPEERNRCRFFVYPPGAPAHELTTHSTYALQTLEARREWLASMAWTWLSPQPALWNEFLSDDWRSELGGHANPEPEDAETERRLAAMTPAERFARTPAQTFWGPDMVQFALGPNPLGAFLKRLTPDPRAEVTTSPRVLSAIRRKASGAMERDVPDAPGVRGAETRRQARQQQMRAARRRLGRALTVGDALTTTDIFAAVAQQVMWAVEFGLTVRACGHPRCGRAFVPETARHLYCPDHRDGTARAQRARRPRPGTPPWER